MPRNAPPPAWALLPAAATVLLRELTKPRESTVCLGCGREFRLDAGPYWTWRVGYLCSAACHERILARAVEAGHVA